MLTISDLIVFRDNKKAELKQLTKDSIYNAVRSRAEFGFTEVEILVPNKNTLNLAYFDEIVNTFNESLNELKKRDFTVENKEASVVIKWSF
jgi:2-iminoacetate synthase ThiH